MENQNDEGKTHTIHILGYTHCYTLFVVVEMEEPEGNGNEHRMLLCLIIMVTFS
jgi:hypothetical protein